MLPADPPPNAYWWSGQLRLEQDPFDFIERVKGSMAPIAELKALYIECIVGFGDPRQLSFMKGYDSILLEICERAESVHDLWWAHAQFHDDVHMLPVSRIACAFPEDADYYPRMLAAVRGTLMRKHEQYRLYGKDATIVSEILKPAIMLLDERMRAIGATAR
jgi:hypothetical protein